MDYSIQPNIEPIKILLNTNIPDKETVTLTSSMVYHPSVKEMPRLNEYPFIVMDRPYEGRLSTYLNRLSYDKKVKFFFNKDSHLKGLSTVGLYTPNKVVKRKMESQTEKDENEKNKKTKEMKKELNEEIDKLIRNVNERKTSSLKELEAKYKKEVKDLEREIDNRKYKNFNDTKIDELNKEIKTKKTEFEENIKKDKEKFKAQIKYIKVGYIGVSNDKKKYILTYDGNVKDSKVQLGNVLINDDIKTDEYEPLYLKENGEPKYPNPITELEKIKETDDKNKEKNDVNEKPRGLYSEANDNVMVLLQTLFPNCFPVLNNISQSYKSMILKESLPFTFKNAIPTFLIPNAYVSQFYSYLKIEGKVYTTTQLVWLNDIYNHPIYSSLVSKYKIFNAAKDGAKQKLEKELDKKREKFRKDFGPSGQFAIDSKLTRFFEKQKKPEPERPVYGDNTSRDLNLTIDKIIEDIENLITYLDFDPPKYKMILDVTNSIRQRYKSIEDKIVKTKDIDTKLTRLVKSIGDINTYEVVFSKFLDNTEIVLDYDTEDEKVKTELKSKYGFYVTFVDSLKEFIKPTRESSNSDLQEVLEDFSNGVGGVGEQSKFANLMNASELTLPGSTNKNDANTGVSILPATGKDPRLEIQVQMDFIEGELNDENKSKINCIYKGEFLGTMLDQLLYPNKTSWELNKKRLFFNINDKEVQKEIKEKEAKLAPPPTTIDKKDETKPVAEQPKEVENAKQGGKRMTYKLLPIYKLRRRTRRNYK
jgi:hypothetical protein